MKTTINKSFTLFEFLSEQYPDSPRARIKKLLQSGTIRVNNESITLHSYPLNPGDIVDINLHPGISAKARLPFPVLYEDQHVIVIDKPAGISTSSTDGSKSILQIISQFLKQISKGKVRAFVVHRIDKEVSGVLLFAKSDIAMNTIKDKWIETEKHYFALVEGIPVSPEGTIKSWLIEDKSLKMHSVTETANAKFAITHYKTIRLLNNYALLDIKTDTGRKNQIRVHLSDIGCPIVGDRKYGASSDYVRRVRLHAYSLSFPHPVNGELITVKSPMPSVFLSLKAKDEHYK
ncbi:MAG: RluA family pseudouridine synthase [Bacteroidia bacterium]|nr:RluA family pseudouridine synthase [Bacteroidia bacterium]